MDGGYKLPEADDELHRAGDVADAEPTRVLEDLRAMSATGDLRCKEARAEGRREALMKARRIVCEFVPAQFRLPVLRELETEMGKLKLSEREMAH